MVIITIKTPQKQPQKHWVPSAFCLPVRDELHQSCLNKAPLFLIVILVPFGRLSALRFRLVLVWSVQVFMCTRSCLVTTNVITLQVRPRWAQSVLWTWTLPGTIVILISLHSRKQSFDHFCAGSARPRSDSVCDLHNTFDYCWQKHPLSVLLFGLICPYAPHCHPQVRGGWI